MIYQKRYRCKGKDTLQYLEIPSNLSNNNETTTTNANPNGSQVSRSIIFRLFSLRRCWGPSLWFFKARFFPPRIRGDHGSKSFREQSVMHSSIKTDLVVLYNGAIVNVLLPRPDAPILSYTIESSCPVAQYFETHSAVLNNLSQTGSWLLPAASFRVYNYKPMHPNYAVWTKSLPRTSNAFFSSGHMPSHFLRLQHWKDCCTCYNTYPDAKCTHLNFKIF